MVYYFGTMDTRQDFGVEKTQSGILIDIHS